MERDSLLAHGASFCLNDRLMKCSDYSEGYVCKKCGSIISCYLNKEIRKNETVIQSKESSGLGSLYNINQ
jgi:DNA-directed RNA polymerase I subunit RPA2